MAIRKRRWTTDSGEPREAWTVFYKDAKGVRRQKVFERKRDADDFAATTHVEVARGTHVADRASISIAAAGKLWIASSKARGLTATTLAQYQQHVDIHIEPLLGRTKVSQLTVPRVREFEDQLREGGRSPAMVRKVLTSLSSLVADAVERGLAARNPVRDLRGGRKAKEHRSERKAKLRVGVDIPTPAEVRAFVGALEGRWKPLLLAATFSGLRASELRGLRWADIDLERKIIRVAQRADAWGDIDLPKSEAGERELPVPPLVVNVLKAWKLECPKGRLGLAFPNTTGGVASHQQARTALMEAWIRAGVTVATEEVDKEGAPILAAKYTGLHSLRHFYASWCINPPSAGGLGLTPKATQQRLGHSSIRLTMDVYGHLFPTDDDGEELAAAERALLG